MASTSPIVVALMGYEALFAIPAYAGISVQILRAEVPTDRLTLTVVVAGARIFGPRRRLIGAGVWATRDV